MFDKKFYIVTGMPRSGTSLTAGILHHLGIDMLNGQSLRRDKKNATGYYENLKVVNVNMMISNSRTFMGLLGSAKDNGEIRVSNPNVYENIVKGLFISKHSPIGIKDPRFLFGELFTVFFNTVRNYTCLENIFIIFTYRNMVSIVKSLRNIDPKIEMSDNEISLHLMRIYCDALYLATKAGCAYTIVNYDDVIADPEGSVGRLASFCGVDNLNVIKNAVGLVNPNLRRF